MNIQNISRDDFKHKIISDWCAYFDSSPRELTQSGSSYLKRENYPEGRIIIAHVNQRTFVQYCPGIESFLLSFADLCPPHLAVTADHLISYFENDRMRIDCIDHLRYLHPADLNLFPPGDKYRVRKLTAGDAHNLETLNQSCSPEEVENSFVEIDELGVWGCFNGEQLVSAAGFSDWGLYGDIGVITHPEFRQRGLAKSVVSAACREIFDIGKIPLYRCHITLFPSIQTARSIGFSIYPQTYVKMEVLRFRKETVDREET